MSIKKQTFSGLIWSLGETFILKGLSFLAMIYLARILGPKEFGIFGIISIFVSIGTTIVDSGLSSSIIRTEKIDDNDLSTIFFLNIFTSVFIYLIVFCLAPLIADYYNINELVSILRIYGLSFIITAFSTIHVALLNKEMKFQKMLFLNTPGIFIGVLIGITLAHLDFGVKSIIYMYLSTQIIQTVLIWNFSGWSPSFIFSTEKMKYHYQFGYKLLLSGLLDTVYRNIYNFLIGKYYSIKSLGYYERANSLNDYPVSILTGVINKVAFPILSKIQSDQNTISNVYKQMIKSTFFITTPLICGAAAIAKPLFLISLGNEWLPSVAFFKIICIASIFYPVHSFNISVLKVYGRSDLFLKLEIFKKVIITISIIISLNFGILGLVWSTVLSSIIALLINTHHSSKIIQYSTKRQILDMIPVLFISFIVYVLMSIILTLLESYPLFIQILIPSLSGIFIYVGANYINGSRVITNLLKTIQDRKT